MLLDALFDFAKQQSLSGTSAQNSTNVHDAGSAKKLFAGSGRGKLDVVLTAVGGTNPTFRAQLVGADDAALSSNVITIADTGTTPVLSASDIPAIFELVPGNQQTAKRYYGVIFTQGGTSPTGTVTAQYAHRTQNNLVR